MQQLINPRLKKYILWTVSVVLSAMILTSSTCLAADSAADSAAASNIANGTVCSTVRQKVVYPSFQPAAKAVRLRQSDTMQTVLGNFIDEAAGGFSPDPDHPLPLALQQHRYSMEQKYNIPEGVLDEIMWRESRFIVDVTDHYNTNGSQDRGLCQINSCNWNWLKIDYNLDVSDPYDNIECAALMLSMFLDKYDLETALACYAAGEAGMQRGEGRRYAAAFMESLNTGFIGRI